MDGEITIGTRLDTDKFDRQISDVEKKMKKEEDKKIVIDAKLSGQEKELEKAREKADELKNAYQELKEVQDKLTVHQGKPEDFMTFQDLQSTYGSLEKLGSEFDKALTKQNAIEQKVAQTKYRYDEINAKVSEYKQKIENVKIQKQVADVEKLKQGFNNVGNSIENSIKKVGRLALGIFGIRSAYMTLRRASSDLAGYDEQYATNLEYIRFVLTQAIAPVLRGIVSLAMKLLQLINMIVNALFGVNLFSKGSAESFNKMKKGASRVSKAVKEIKKQLTGFDEINMLTDQSDSGTSAGAGGVGMPDVDLSKIQGKTPEWIKWLGENKDLVFAVLAGIASGLLAIKFGLDGIKALGIGIFIASIIKLIQDLKKYMKDPSWENFGKMIQDIGLAVAGLALVFHSVPLAVAGAIITIIGTLVQNWDKIRKGFDNAINFINNGILNLQKWFVENIDKIWDKAGYFGVGVVAIVVGAASSIMGIISGLITAIRQLLDGLFTGIKNIFNGILQIFGGKFKQGILTIMKGIGNIIIGIINGVTSAINAILYPIRSLIVEGAKLAGKNLTLNIVKIPQIPLLKSGGIINMPNKRSNVRWSNWRRKRSRRCTSIDRYASNGNIRKRNRKMDNNKC